ncbi:hypothetical protein FA13DRAFT_1725238 [Coprinellus micaceus]|uniref:DUF6697 domain-containing protein n=1 Tax=Coprinellus micaceus TaxID=71717 RepID=A0A4Y7U0E5_COPMI|nr:hypothetical protein FA13DRAFT_1725238 [Coprinellus micaceus]
MSDNDEDGFLTQVLQKLTTAKLDVTRLTKELRVAVGERDKLRNELEQARNQRNRATNANEEPNITAGCPQRRTVPCHASTVGTPSTVPYDENRTVDLQKLSELELGLTQAQSSYERIAKQLEDNQAMIQDLMNNNRVLQDERNTVKSQRDASQAALRTTEDDLRQARLENEKLRERIRALTRQPSLGSGQGPTVPVKVEQVNEGAYQLKIASLEHEAPRRTCWLAEEKHDVQSELDIVRSKLDKIKQSKSALHDQLKGLGELQARTRSASISSRAPSTRTTRSQAATATSPQSTLSSLFFGSSGSPTGPSSRLRTIPSTISNLTVIDLTKTEDKTPEDDVPTPRPADYAPAEEGVPASRRSHVAAFPVVNVNSDIGLGEGENAFSRDFMTTALGGSIQPLVVRVAKQSTLAKKRDVNAYLCPGLDHNPWCPSIPGRHGYIFVGLGREKDTFLEPEEHNVFVGLKKKGKDTRRFKYLGKYRAVRVQPLTKEEWAGLPEPIRKTYAKTTKDKTKDTRSADDVAKAYDSGELTVPCVQLQCIDFDYELYKAMVVENAKQKLKGKSSLISSGSNKRACEYDADDDSSRKRRNR